MNSIYKRRSVTFADRPEVLNYEANENYSPKRDIKSYCHNISNDSTFEEKVKSVMLRRSPSSKDDKSIKRYSISGPVFDSSILIDRRHTFCHDNTSKNFSYHNNNNDSKYYNNNNNSNIRNSTYLETLKNIKNRSQPSPFRRRPLRSSYYTCLPPLNEMEIRNQGQLIECNILLKFKKKIIKKNSLIVINKTNNDFFFFFQI